jgi:hypothetical protein
MARNSTETDSQPEAEAISGGRNSSLFAAPQLRAIGSLEDAIALGTEILGTPMVDAADEIGNGFEILRSDQKHLLIDQPFYVLTVDFQEGDIGPFCSALIVTEGGKKYVLNDGGTGIYQQLEDWCNTQNKRGGMMVNHGLRESKYDLPEEYGGGVGTTYYLNP